MGSPLFLLLATAKLARHLPERRVVHDLAHRRRRTSTLHALGPGVEGEILDGGLRRANEATNMFRTAGFCIIASMPPPPSIC